MAQPVKAVGGFFGEFKAFALKGNMIDLAVGVIIGAAFGKVIDSLVKHIFMPALSYVTPNQSYTEWHLGKLQVGLFLGELVNFTIVALAVFIAIVKVVGFLTRRRKQDENAAAEPKPVPEDIQLLTEIRDLLARNQRL
jgi:large conductance mechanosensitive channel